MKLIIYTHKCKILHVPENVYHDREDDTTEYNNKIFVLPYDVPFTNVKPFYNQRYYSFNTDIDNCYNSCIVEVPNTYIYYVSYKYAEYNFTSYFLFNNEKERDILYEDDNKLMLYSTMSECITCRGTIDMNMHLPLVSLRDKYFADGMLFYFPHDIKYLFKHVNSLDSRMFQYNKKDCYKVLNSDPFYLINSIKYGIKYIVGDLTKINPKDYTILEEYQPMQKSVNTNKY